MNLNQKSIKENDTMSNNIDLLMNFPEKAIRKLAFPLILTNLLFLSNNIIDGIWIAGLGADYLTGIGFVSPIILLILGFANGLNSGANSMISRCIGAKNYKNASNSAIHSIVLSIVISLFLTILLFIFIKPLLLLFGAGKVIDISMSYAIVYIGGLFSIFIAYTLSTIFKAEGDIKRATYPLLIGAILNIITTPILIYMFKLGIYGAVYSTVFSNICAMLILIYLVFIKKDSFIKIDFNNYKSNWKIYKDILYVGVPVSLEYFSIVISTIIVNIWILHIALIVDIAVYNVVWRVISIGTTSVSCIAVAVSTVAGIAYGGHNYENLKKSFYYGLKLSLLISFIISLLFFMFAGQLAYLFSYTNSSLVLNQSLVLAIRILVIYQFIVPLGMVSSMTFQGMGKGNISFLITISRTLIFELIFIYLLIFILHMGIPGVYIGLDCGMFVGSLLGFVFTAYYINNLLKKEN